MQNANSIFQLTYSSSYPLLINPFKFQTSNEKFLPNITWINHELNRSPQINSGQFEGKPGSIDLWNRLASQLTRFRLLSNSWSRSSCSKSAGSRRESAINNPSPLFDTIQKWTGWKLNVTHTYLWVIHTQKFFSADFSTKQVLFSILFYFILLPVITCFAARDIMKLPAVDNEFIFIGQDPHSSSLFGNKYLPVVVVGIGEKKKK